MRSPVTSQQGDRANSQEVSFGSPYYERSYLQALNGGPYSVHRIGRGRVLIENLSMSLTGAIQPGPLRKIADESIDDGLLQRLLPLVLKPAVEGRTRSRLLPLQTTCVSLAGCTASTAPCELPRSQRILLC
jgi:hypothetical protein